MEERDRENSREGKIMKIDFNGAFGLGLTIVSGVVLVYRGLGKEEAAVALEDCTRKLNSETIGICKETAKVVVQATKEIGTDFMAKAGLVIGNIFSLFGKVRRG
jgi:hypothetical protein